MNLSSDQQILWQYGFVKLNETIITTWTMMLVLAFGSWLVTRKLLTEGPMRWQGLLEILVTGIEDQIQAVGLAEPAKYLPFLGTLFVFGPRPPFAP